MQVVEIQYDLAPILTQPSCPFTSLSVKEVNSFRSFAKRK